MYLSREDVDLAKRLRVLALLAEPSFEADRELLVRALVAQRPLRVEISDALIGSPELLRAAVGTDNLTALIDNGELPLTLRARAYRAMWLRPHVTLTSEELAALFVGSDSSRLWKQAFPDGASPHVKTLISLPTGSLNAMFASLENGTGMPLPLRLAVADLLLADFERREKINGAVMTAEQRKQIIATLRRSLTSPSTRPRAESTFAQLVGYLGTHEDFSTLRRFLNSAQLAGSTRLVVVNQLAKQGKVSVAEMFAFAEAADLSADDRAKLADIVWNSLYRLAGPNFEDLLRNTLPIEQFREEARQAGPSWQALLQEQPHLEDSLDLGGRVASACDPEQPALARTIASLGVTFQAAEIPDLLRGGIARQLLAAMEDPELPSHVLVALATAFHTTYPLSRQRRPDETLRKLMTNTRLPIAHRRALLKCIPETYLTPTVARALWDVAGIESTPEIRAQVLECLVQSGQIGGEVVSDLVRALKNGADATAAWEAAQPLHALIGQPVSQLLKVALERRAPRAARLSALSSLEKQAVRTQLRPLWNLTGDEDPQVAAHAHAIIARQYPAIGDITESPLYTPNVIQAGPSHPLWNFVVALAQLPDQNLATTALEAIDVPYRDAQNVLRWHAQHAPAMPPAAVLSAAALVGETSSAQSLNAAFEYLAHGRSKTAELVEAVTAAAINPEPLREYVRGIIASCRVDSDNAESFAELIQYATLESENVLRGSAANLFSNDLSDLARSLPAIPKDVVSVDERMRQIKERLGKSLAPILKIDRSEIIERAPKSALLLAGQYTRIHPGSLPVLGEAMTAVESGRWRAFRYDHPEGRRQLRFLTDLERTSWRENLSQRGEIVTVPEDIRVLAQRWRDQTRQLIENRELPSDLTALVEVPADRIASYQAIVRSLGPLGEDPSRSLPEEALAQLPDRVRTLLGDLLARVRAHSDPKERFALLYPARQKLEQAIGILRLRHCDERALARNELRAAGELNDPAKRARSAIGYLQQLAHAVENPEARRARDQAPQNREADNSLSVLRSLLREGVTAVQGVKTFAPVEEFTVSEEDDFQTLIEIGNRPYAQGSCQSYTSLSEVNKTLLGYAVDAMTKVVAVRSSDGDLRARAIIRVGSPEDKGKPVVFLEPVYAAGGDVDQYAPLIEDAARAFARRRGWRLAKPARSRASNVTVDIPESRNSAQYEDGHAAVVAGTRDPDFPGICYGPYRVSGIVLDKS